MKKNPGTLTLLIALLVLAASVGCDSSRRSEVRPPTDPGGCVPSEIAGELIVVFVSTATESEARAVIEEHDLTVLQVSLGFSAGLENRWLLVGVPPGSERFWIAELAKSPLVTIVEQNSVFCVG